MKKLLTLFTLLLTVCSGAWGEKVSFVGGTASGQINVTSGSGSQELSSTPVTINIVKPGAKSQDRQIWKDGSTVKNEYAFQLSSSAGSDYNTKYVEISVASGYKITGVTLRAANAGGTTAGTIYGYCFEGAFSTETGAVKAVGSFAVPGNGGTSDGANVAMTGIVDGTRTIRIYKQVKYDSETNTINGTNGSNYPSSAISANIASITVTYAVASTDPTLTVAETPSTFTYDLNEGTGPSDAQTFTVSLANSEKTISATLSNITDYEMKTGEGDWGTADLTTLSSGDAVQVRLKSGLSVGEHNGKLTFTSDGADDLELDLTGSVTNTVAINLAWNKTSDIVATNSDVTAPVFSNDGGLEVNTTNFNFAITGTSGIISVNESGIVTINSETKGEATVTASVIADGYSADPVAYTIRVADAATKWNFATVKDSEDQYNLIAAHNASSGWTETTSSSNKRYTSAAAISSEATANGNVLKSLAGLRSTKAVRLDVSEKAGTYSTAGRIQVNTDLTLKNLKKGQKVTIIYASANSDYERNVTTTGLDNMSGFVAKKSGEAPATGVGYVKADGDVTFTITQPNASDNKGPVINIAKIVVEDYVPVTVTDAKYATFASTEDLDFSGVDGLSAYTASVANTIVTFNEVTGSVKAGDGLLLYADVDANTTYYVPVATDSPALVSGNKLVRGTGESLTYVEDATEYYILSKEGNKVGFYKANGNVVSENKAYLDLTETNAKAFALPGGETDGIRSIDNSELRVENSNYYNLAGQRVGKDYKGIVIVNGKKMLNK